MYAVSPDLLVLLLEVVDALLLVGDGLLPLPNLFLVPLLQHRWAPSQKKSMRLHTFRFRRFNLYMPPLWRRQTGNFLCIKIRVLLLRVVRPSYGIDRHQHEQKNVCLHQVLAVGDESTTLVFNIVTIWALRRIVNVAYITGQSGVGLGRGEINNVYICCRRRRYDQRPP